MNSTMALGKLSLFLCVMMFLTSCGSFNNKRSIVRNPSRANTPTRSTTKPKPPRPAAAAKPKPPKANNTSGTAVAGTSTAKEKKLRKNMVGFGKNYLGTPYKYGGKTPGTGFDCSGFTCYVYQKFGLKLSGSSRYQAQEGQRISPENARPGDLIIFGNSGKINHVAMVAEVKYDGIYVIHSTSRGVVIDNISKSSYWKPRTMYGRRVVGN